MYKCGEFLHNFIINPLALKSSTLKHLDFEQIYIITKMKGMDQKCNNIFYS